MDELEEMKKNLEDFRENAAKIVNLRQAIYDKLAANYTKSREVEQAGLNLENRQDWVHIQVAEDTLKGTHLLSLYSQMRKEQEKFSDFVDAFQETNVSNEKDDATTAALKENRRNEVSSWKQKRDEKAKAITKMHQEIKRLKNELRKKMTPAERKFLTAMLGECYEKLGTLEEQYGDIILHMYEVVATYIEEKDNVIENPQPSIISQLSPEAGPVKSRRERREERERENKIENEALKSKDGEGKAKGESDKGNPAESVAKPYPDEKIFHEHPEGVGKGSHNINSSKDGEEKKDLVPKKSIFTKFTEWIKRLNEKDEEERKNKIEAKWQALEEGLKEGKKDFPKFTDVRFAYLDLTGDYIGKERKANALTGTKRKEAEKAIEKFREKRGIIDEQTPKDIRLLYQVVWESLPWNKSEQIELDGKSREEYRNMLALACEARREGKTPEERFEKLLKGYQKQKDIERTTREIKEMTQNEERIFLTDYRDIIPDLREQAEKCIIPERIPEWKKEFAELFKENSELLSRHVDALSLAIEGMEMLKGGATEREASEVLKKSGKSPDTIKEAANLVLEYDLKGTEIYKNVYEGMLDATDIDRIREQEEMNEAILKKRKAEVVRTALDPDGSSSKGTEETGKKRDYSGTIVRGSKRDYSNTIVSRKGKSDDSHEP